MKNEHKLKVELDFPADEREPALNELGRIKLTHTMNGENNLNNAISAVLQLSKGSLSELRRLVDAAIKDFRDVIYWASLEDKRMSQKFDIRLTGVAVTPQSIFLVNKYDELYKPERLISDAEKRLHVSLPDGLKQLYRIQNGGHINNVCVPIKDGVELLYAEAVFPFGGYNDLLPIERLITLWESITGFASPDDPDQADEFPEGCEKMIILARWYDRTLFLDFNYGSKARVGFTDFGKSDWKTEGHFWKSFDSFFCDLSHYEE